MTLTRRTTIEPEGLLRMIPPFWGKPRMASLLVTCLEAVQGCHDQIWSVIDRWDVDTAPYLTLTWLAKWVGEPKRPPTADGLRTLVKGRIMANRSSGTGPDLYALGRALFSAMHGMQEDRFSLALFVTDPGVSDPDYAVELVDDAASAGTATAVITIGTFGFYDAADGDPGPADLPDFDDGTLGDRHGFY